MGVEIEPLASEAIKNVSSKGVSFNMHRTCILKNIHQKHDIHYIGESGASQNNI